MDCLKNIFDVLKNGEEFTEFYFGDTKTELLWIAIYKLGMKNVPLLFAFLKEQNVDTFSKTPVTQALEQLFYHQENLRKPIIAGFRDLSAYFIANKEDESLTDTDVIASVACSMRDIAVEQLKEQIKELYVHDLVSLNYAGNFESLMYDKISNEWDKRFIPSITEMYENVIMTWAGYKEDEENNARNNRENDEVGVDTNWLRHGDEDMPYDYVDPKPFVRPEPKIGRNDTCPCGSGKKYKKCCMKLEGFQGV